MNGSATLDLAKRSLLPHQRLSPRPLSATESTSLIGVVVDGSDLPESSLQANHVQVEYTTNDSTVKRVIAELSRELKLYVGDRVLVVLPGNASLGVITTVLSPETPGKTRDKFVNESSLPPLKSNQELILRDSESLCVTTSSGQTLVAIERGATGPIIRLGQGSLELDMPGELHLMADSLRFTTRNGPISIQSQTDDVVVQGRTIRLN